jgi:hypothetical protein
MDRGLDSFRVFGLDKGKKESRRADSNRLPLLQLRVIIHALQGIAQVCKSRISKRFSLLGLAQCCTVLRSRWYQSGIKLRSLGASGSSPLTWCIWGDPSLRLGQAAMACRVCSAVTSSVVVPSALSRSARPFWPAPQLELDQTNAGRPSSVEFY